MKNYRKQIDLLYENNRYYVKINRKISKNKIDYWGKVLDPDKRIRNRISLKEKKLFRENIVNELQFIKKINVGKVLDIGCGPGWFLSFINSKWEKIGIEPSYKAYIQSKKIFKTYNDNFENVKLKKNSFNLIIMHHVIEHTVKPEIIIRDIYDLLKKNGYLIISTPDFDSGCARRFKNKYRLLNDKTHISLFTNDSMHRFLRDHKFKIKKVDYPFFETRYFNNKNLFRLKNTKNISPPFYGNFMTFYAQK